MLLWEIGEEVVVSPLFDFSFTGFINAVDQCTRRVRVIKEDGSQEWYDMDWVRMKELIP